MFKHSSSTLGLCVALCLVFSITFSSFPKTRSGIVLAQTGRTQKSAPTSNQQKGSAAPTAKAQPQKTPVPNAAQVVTITATNRDSFPVHLDGTAHQGDVITYSVAITNSGDTDATGVNFNDTVDANTSTLVGGSPTIQFTVTGDTYSAIGNVRLDTSTITPGSGQTVLENDTTNGATLTGFGATLAAANGTVPNGSNTVTTSNNGTVTMNANGSFTYNPPAGLGGAGATDSFWYTLTNNALGTGNPSGFPSGSARVTINVSTPIWFVNQAAAGGGDGRLSTPFNCLTGAGCFSAVNDGVGSHPAAGDFIFLYKNPNPPAAFIGGLTLLNNQKLIGEGASQSLATIAGVSVPPGSDPLPSTGNPPPVITTGGASINGINIGFGNSNTLRGFTIGNTTGFKIASGASFGTLTTSELLLNGTGGALSLNAGTLAATFTSITSLSSATQGIALTSVTGSLTSLGGTAISGNTTQCILMTGSTANADFGNTSCSGGTDGISLQNNPSGTRTFGTLGVLGGSGDAFIHGAGGGNVTVNGVATLTSALDPVNIQNVANGTLINFAGGATVTKITTGGAGVTWAGTNTGATLTFNSLSVTTSNGAGMVMSGGGTVNVTNGTGSISATGSGAQPAPAIAVSSAIALNANFSSVSSTNSGGGSNGISLVNVTGTSNFGTGSLAGAAGATFLVNGSTGTVTYNGTITQGNAARVVDIQNKTGGTITLGGAVSSTGGTGTGIFLNSNTGATINFQGGIALTTNANPAFTATAGGTVNVCDESPCNPAATGALVNTLTTTTATALNVANTTIGSNNLEFKSISAGTGASGPTNGIILSNTGAGSLTVKGDGNASVGGNSSGGIIQHATGHGISLSSTTSPSFTNMNIHDTALSGINGLQVTNFTFANGTIDVVGTGGAPDDANISFNDNLANGNANVTGTVSITNSILNHARYHGVDIQQDTGTLAAVTVSGNTFTSDSSITTSLGSAVRIIALGSSTTVANVTKATLANNNITNFNTGAGFVLQGGNAADVVTAPAGTFGVPGNVTNVIAVTGNLMNGGTLGVGNQPDRFVTAAVNGRGQGNFDVSNNGTLANPIKNIDGVVIEISAFGLVTVTDTVLNNIITANNAVGSSGIGIGADSDSLTTTADTPSMTSTINGNTVSLTDGPGIFAIARNSNGTHNVTIKNNTVAAPNTTTAARAGIRVDSGSAAGNVSLCLDISGNTTAGSTNTGTATTSPGINLRKQGTAPATNFFGIEGMAATASPGVENFVNGQNTSTSGTFGVGGTALLSATSGFSNCASAPIAPPGGDGLVADVFVSETASNTPAPKRAGSHAVIGHPVVSPAKAEAIETLGTVAQTLAAPGNLLIGSLNKIAPHQETPERKNEAKATPLVSAATMRAAHSSSTEGKVQVGHAGAIVPVKAASLESANNRSREVRSNHAVRRLALADDKPLSPQSGGTVNLSVGTITAGSTVVLTFQVTVNNTAPANASNVSNQGTVSGSNFASVLTDDPDTVAALDPTLTPLLHPTAANGIVSGRITTSDGAAVEGAVMTLSGTQSRKMITDANGNYRFDNVETNGFYTVTPSRANYNFNPFNRSFTQIGNSTEAIFTATSTGDSVNPLDTPEYFVRQQYVDLLGREPEEDGFNYWSDLILECGSDALCVNARRRDVAAAFFIEAEFQQTGSFIYGLYKGSLGRVPAYTEYASDRQQVVGGANLESEKAAFAASFVARGEFVSRYQSNTTADSFVDALLANVQQASGIDLSSQRAALTATYNTGANLNESRSLVVRELTESADFRQAEYNGAFVLTEYFGYLRRDAEPEGYNFWLDVLNNREPGNFRGMVCSFITSREYQQRFSAIVSHSNQECGQ